MALPTSGTLSMSAIANEQGVALSNVSLRSISSTAGFVIPDSMSEFYGYSSVPPAAYLIVGGEYTTYQGVTRTNLSSLDVDASLNTIITTPFANGLYVLKYQSTNKLIYGGNAFSGTRLRRLNTNHTADNTFNPFGISGILRTISIQSDDRIIAGGNFLTRRLLVDGANDTTFTASSFTNQPFDSVIQSDGKIVMVGTFTAYGGVTTNRIIRLNTNGTRDTTFNIGTGFDAFATKLAIQPDGKFIVVGTFTTYNGVGRNRIARLNSDGTLDTTFSVGTGFNNRVESILLQSDGKVVVGGTFTTYNGVGRNRIARLNSDGTLDTTFSVGTGFNSTVFAIIEQPFSNNEIVVGGSFTTYNGVTRNRIARLNSDGTLDTTFDPLVGYNSTVLVLLFDHTFTGV